MRLTKTSSQFNVALLHQSEVKICILLTVDMLEFSVLRLWIPYIHWLFQWSDGLFPTYIILHKIYSILLSNVELFSHKELTLLKRL